MRRVRGPELAQFIVTTAPPPAPQPPLGDAPVAFNDGHPRNVPGGVDVHLLVGPIAPGANVPMAARAVFSPVVVPPGADLDALVNAGYPMGVIEVVPPEPTTSGIVIPLHAAAVPEAGYHLVCVLDYAN